jgi:hypothetical protein
MFDSHDGDSVHVDCDSCVVRGPSACGDCLVTVLLGAPPAGVRIDTEEQAALDVLAAAGVVPPLRLVRSVVPDPGTLTG